MMAMKADGLFVCLLLWFIVSAAPIEAAAKAKIAILKDETMPIRNSAPSSPSHFASLLGSAGYEVRFIRAKDLANLDVLNIENVDLLILPHGSAFPYEAIEPMKTYLKSGGSFFSTGGYVFDDLYYLNEPDLASRGFHSGFEDGDMEGWSAPQGQAAPGVSFQRVTDVKRSGEFSYRIAVAGEAQKNWYTLSRKFTFARPGESVRGQAYIKTMDVRDGFAYLAFAFYDKNGKRISYAQSATDMTGTMDWSPRSCSGKIPAGTDYVLSNCILYGYGEAWFDDVEVNVIDNRILNTRYGYSAGAGILHTREDQVGAFDASYPLHNARHARTSEDQRIFEEEIEIEGDLKGWSASVVLGSKLWAANMGRRWIPLIDAFDQYNRLRGSIGALVFNYGGPFKGSAWAFFGVNSQDIFDPTDDAMGKVFLRVIARMLEKTFAHDLTSNYYCYRQGEPVGITLNVSNLGRSPQELEVRLEIAGPDLDEPLFAQSKSILAEPGSTTPAQFEWKPEKFDLDFYRYRAVVLSEGEVIDELTNAFVVWNEKAITKGPALRFKDNYFCIGERPTLLCGSNHYSVLFKSLNQNPERWEKDFQLMRDNGVNILRILHLTAEAGEKKPGRSMPDLSNPPEWLLRRFDALVQLSQKNQVALFLSAHDHIKLELNDEDLAAEQRWCEMLARRYACVPGLMWDIQNEPFVFSPRMPNDADAADLYNRYLKSRYKSSAELRAAWGGQYGDVELGKVPLPGTKAWQFEWRDKSAIDFERARVWVLERWINANAEALRKGDADKPITVGYLPTETAADRWLGNDATNFSNFHAYAEADAIPRKLKMIDQRSLGKSMSIGEFGVNFHLGMYRTNGFKKAPWIVEPEEANAHFLHVTHEAFGLGASFVANWLWSDSAEMVFSMGLIHAHRHVPRDALRVYRNCSLFFRQFKLMYVEPEVYFVIADNHRLGGQSARVTDAILNGLDMLINCHVEFSVINESNLDKLPKSARALIYPIPFCPSDETYDALCQFVREGGAVYISGDISYDPSRERARTNRLEELCGVRFIRENYPNVMCEKAAPVKVAEVERRPCIEIDPIAADAIGDDDAAHPIAVANRFGRGFVYFTTDPIELYADPTRTETYRDFLTYAGIPRIAVSPDKPTLRVYHRKTQDGGDVYVVFNAERDTYERVALSDAEPEISVDVHALKPGIVALNPEGKIVAGESQGDIVQGFERIIEGDTHFMISAMDGKPIKESSALLLMPFVAGTIRIASEALGNAPSATVGEIRNGKWARLDSARCRQDNRSVSVTVTDAQALSLILLAPKGMETEAARRLEEMILLKME